MSNITDKRIIDMLVAHSNHKQTAESRFGVGPIEYEVISHGRAIEFARQLLAEAEIQERIVRYTAAEIDAMVSRDDDEDCPVCGDPLEAGDVCSIGVELGTCHAECLEGVPIVDLETREPIEGPADTFIYCGDEPAGYRWRGIGEWIYATRAPDGIDAQPLYLRPATPAPVDHVMGSTAHERIARIIGDYVDLSDSRYSQMMDYVLDEVPDDPEQDEPSLQHEMVVTKPEADTADPERVYFRFVRGDAFGQEANRLRIRKWDTKPFDGAGEYVFSPARHPAGRREAARQEAVRLIERAGLEMEEEYDLLVNDISETILRFAAVPSAALSAPEEDRGN